MQAQDTRKIFIGNVLAFLIEKTTDAKVSVWFFLIIIFSWTILNTCTDILNNQTEPLLRHSIIFIMEICKKGVLNGEMGGFL